MKRKFTAILLSLSAIIQVFTVTLTAGNAPTVSAESAVLIEADSKDVIFAKNHLQKMPMASTTKIMTALVVLDTLPTDHVFTVADRAVGTEGSSAYLKKGDTMSVRSALFALLLQSANDVAVALALEVSDSIEGFASLMNEKAASLGLKDTSFKNPSGLPDEGHYTTAYDFAILASYAMENETFYSIVSAKSATVKIGGNDRTFVNHNRLLSLYDGAVGVKTGFTKESGRCLVGACEQDGVRLITVTLNASDDWNDHCRMFDLGLSKYRSVCLCTKKDFIIELPVAGADGCITASPKEDKYITLPKNSKITVSIEAKGLLMSPVTIGSIIATAIFRTEDKVIAKVPLFATADI